MNQEEKETANSILRLQRICHVAALKWWQDPLTGQYIDRNVGELLCLIHSEISEALEGARKDKMDDHLPHRKSIEVELADALIRIFDTGCGLGLDLGSALVEKMQYNAYREDHKIESRLKADGKKF